MPNLLTPILSFVMTVTLAVGTLAAADGVSDTELLIGQCAALKGPAAGLGTNMNLGLRACFDEANAKGGVHGRKLKLIAVDDGYDPDQCVDGTLKLLEESKVFCLAGYVGTPTGKAAIPVITEKQVPLVGLFTGAGLFRKPVNPWIFNVRASYDDETELLVERLTKDLGAKKIAVFFQNDSFGQAGLSGTEKALTKRSMALAAKGTFERNTVAVKAGLAQILAGQPDAVVMVGPYKPIAAFVKEARSTGLKVPFATISFVGTESLISELAADADGLIISQVVPSPADASIPLVKDFQAALKAVDTAAKPTYGSLEGYLGGRVLITGLDKAGKDLSRPGLVAALESLQKADVGGVSVTFTKDNHQALSQVYLTQVGGGEAKPTAALKP